MDQELILKLFDTIFSNSDSKLQLLLKYIPEKCREVWFISYQGSNCSFKVVLTFEPHVANSSQLYFTGTFDRQQMNQFMMNLKIDEKFDRRYLETLKVFQTIMQFLSLFELPQQNIENRLLIQSKQQEQSLIHLQHFSIKPDQLLSSLKMVLSSNCFLSTQQSSDQLQMENDFKIQGYLSLSISYPTTKQVDSENNQFLMSTITNQLNIFENQYIAEVAKVQDNLDNINDNFIDNIKQKQGFLISEISKSLDKKSNWDVDEINCISQIAKQSQQNSKMQPNFRLSNSISSLISLIPKAQYLMKDTDSNYFQKQFRDQICIWQDEFQQIWKCKKHLEDINFLLIVLYIPRDCYEIKYLDKIKGLMQFHSPYSCSYVHHWMEFDEIQRVREMNTVFLQVEYYSEQNLKEYFDQQLHLKLKYEELWKITAQLIQGLIDIHQEGLSHQNIQPSSILIKDTKIKFFNFSIGSRFTMCADNEINIVYNNQYSYDVYSKSKTLKLEQQEDINCLCELLQTLWQLKQIDFEQSKQGYGKNANIIQIVELIKQLRKDFKLNQVIKDFSSYLQIYDDIFAISSENRENIIKLLQQSLIPKRKSENAAKPLFAQQEQLLVFDSFLQHMQNFTHFINKQHLNYVIPFCQLIDYQQNNVLTLSQLQSRISIGSHNKIKVNVEGLPIIDFIFSFLDNNNLTNTEIPNIVVYRNYSDSQISFCGTKSQTHYFTSIIQFVVKKIHDSERKIVLIASGEQELYVKQASERMSLQIDSQQQQDTVLQSYFIIKLTNSLQQEFQVAYGCIAGGYWQLTLDLRVITQNARLDASEC